MSGPSSVHKAHIKKDYYLTKKILLGLDELAPILTIVITTSAVS